MKEKLKKPQKSEFPAELHNLKVAKFARLPLTCLSLQTHDLGSFKLPCPELLNAHLFF